MREIIHDDKSQIPSYLLIGQCGLLIWASNIKPTVYLNHFTFSSQIQKSLLSARVVELKPCEDKNCVYIIETYYRILKKSDINLNQIGKAN